MKTCINAVMIAAVLGLAGCAHARDTQPVPDSGGVPAMGHTDNVVVTALASGTQAKLDLTSPAFQDGGRIPFENTQYRGNIFPGLQWSPGPDGTKSYLVVVQSDIVRPGGRSSIHLTLFNIPATVSHLDAGMTLPPAGAVYGPNVHGLNQAYAGPHTHGFNMETYHFEVLALDTVLPGDPQQSFEAIETAARGHVLASGDLTGKATMDPDSPEAAKLRGEQKP